jgi:hypothetical protein
MIVVPSSTVTGVPSIVSDIFFLSMNALSQKRYFKNRVRRPDGNVASPSSK